MSNDLYIATCIGNAKAYIRKETHRQRNDGTVAPKRCVGIRFKGTSERCSCGKIDAIEGKYIERRHYIVVRVGICQTCGEKIPSSKTD